MRSLPASSARGRPVAFVAYILALGLVIPIEVARWSESHLSLWEPLRWFQNVNVDTTLPALWLVLAPLFWIRRDGLFWRGRDVLSAGVNRLAKACFPGEQDSVACASGLSEKDSTGRAADAANEKDSLACASGWYALAAGPATWRTWCLALLIGLISFAESAWVGVSFDNLPPAYHDEYSYLFQARTFLAGRLSFPSHPAGHLFDQMHVVNEGRFASRYFPGTGLWMAPFVAWGHPYFGHWLAGALTAMFMFWTGRELGGTGVGCMAGLLTAISPGMALFSNLLLSHHPTLVGISLFLYAFLHWKNGGKVRYTAWAGVGLSFAMLCRPLTAAGVALPCGLWFAWWLIWGRDTPVRHRLAAAVALGGPILLGLIGMFAYNRAITGNGWVTPYQQYTEAYTPRHVFGFHNVTRGERALGDRPLPKVTRNYDVWAEELDSSLAMRNVWARWISSWQWTLGIVPLLLGTVVSIGSGMLRCRGWALILAGILSLHAVHIPYWFDGIMHWHYVFESGPLWLLLFAGATGYVLRCWADDRRPWMAVWWGGLVAICCVTSHFAFEPFWSARLDAGIGQVHFSRARYAAFQKLLTNRVTKRPALVLVQPDPADRHIDYVVNDPSLEASILIGRFDPEESSLKEISKMFPERQIYLYRAKDRRLWFQGMGFGL